MADLLEIEGLTICASTRDGEMTLVDDVSVSVGSGEVLGLIGESGSGKTTTVRSIVGLLERNLSVTAGRVSVLGSQVCTPQRADFARVRGRHVGFVFQGAGSSLDPLLRVGKQLREVIRRHRPDLSRAATESEIEQALAGMGFTSPDRVAHCYPHQLSGGMRQRVSIALAMVAKPELLIADECTSALDVTTQKDVVQLLTTLVAGSGVGLVFVTHDLILAEEICTKIAVMRRGRVVEAGKARDVMGNPRHEYTRQLLASVPRW
jgi:ABC-type dipeptide/oligopeptide/nickel transport system ATPase component